MIETIRGDNYCFYFIITCAPPLHQATTPVIILPGIAPRSFTVAVPAGYGSIVLLVYSYSALTAPVQLIWTGLASSVLLDSRSVTLFQVLYSRIRIRSSTSLLYVGVMCASYHIYIL